MIFGGIGAILALVGGADVVRKREEMHKVQMAEANVAGYWEGFGYAWPRAFRQGELQMLGVTQELAVTTAEMVGLDPTTQQQFSEIVYEQWPQFALQPTPEAALPASSSNMF